MYQIEIGKFIADCRKQKNLTQMQLERTKQFGMQGGSF